VSCAITLSLRPPSPSCPAARRCQLVSRNILLIFSFKKKSFSFYTSPPRPPHTHKGDATRRQQRLLSSPCSARPRRFPLLYPCLCLPACLNDSSAFPFSKSPFSRARVDSFLVPARRRVWAGGTDAASDEAALTGAGPPGAHPWRVRSECTRLGKGTM